MNFKQVFISFVENITELERKNNISPGFLFDLDGVIIDSENEYTRIWAQINCEFPTGVDNFEYKIKGSTLNKILTENYQSEEIRKSVSNRLHQLESEMHYEYLPNVKEFLETLKERQLKCVLVTSSDNKKMSHLWDQIPDLKNFFDYIITGDQVNNSKPNPEGYLLAASKIKKNSQNCVVFEDSLQGVIAGRRANSYVVGVAGTLTSDVLTPYSDIIINDFKELNLDDLIFKISKKK